MAGEREIGKILAGVENLQQRYTTQEGRLGDVEKSVNELSRDFAGRPLKCMKAIEEKYATKESVKPLHDMHRTVKRAAIFMFCCSIGCIAVVFVIVKGITP